MTKVNCLTCRNRLYIYVMFFIVAVTVKRLNASTNFIDYCKFLSFFLTAVYMLHYSHTLASCLAIAFGPLCLPHV